MFTGTFSVGVDSQRRVTMPRSWRLPSDTEETAFYLMPGRGRRIQIVTQERMDAIFDALESTSVVNDDKMSAFTDVASKIQVVTLDKQGRFAISPELTKHAGITTQAVFLGSITCGTILAPGEWTQRDTPLPSNLDILQQLEEIAKG